MLSTTSARNVFDALRTELADLAFDLERQGRRDAADVANMLHARLDELNAHCEAAQATPPFNHDHDNHR